MRADYASRWAGACEGQPPIVGYIYENTDVYEEEAGDTDGPVGWNGRVGKWIVSVDAQGFVAGVKYPSVIMASNVMGILGRLQ